MGTAGIPGKGALVAIGPTCNLIHSFKNCQEGWDDDSMDRVLAATSMRIEFHLQHPCKIKAQCHMSVTQGK